MTERPGLVRKYRFPKHHVHPGHSRSRSRSRNRSPKHHIHPGRSRSRNRIPINISILSSLQNRATRKKLTPSQQERIEEYYRPKNYTVYQYGDEAIETMLAQPYVKVGDTITYQANKQQNTITYKVVYKDLAEQTGKHVILWRTYYNNI